MLETDLEKENNKCLRIEGTPDDRLKNEETNQIKKYLEFARDNKKKMSHKDNGSTNCNGCTWNGPFPTKKDENLNSKEESRPSRPQHC